MFSQCLCNIHLTSHLSLLNVLDVELTTMGKKSRESLNKERVQLGNVVFIFYLFFIFIYIWKACTDWRMLPQKRVFERYPTQNKRRNLCVKMPLCTRFCRFQWLSAV